MVAVLIPYQTCGSGSIRRDLTDRIRESLKSQKFPERYDIWEGCWGTDGKDWSVIGEEPLEGARLVKHTHLKGISTQEDGLRELIKRVQGAGYKSLFVFYPNASYISSRMVDQLEYMKQRRRDILFSNYLKMTNGGVQTYQFDKKSVKVQLKHGNFEMFMPATLCLSEKVTEFFSKDSCLNACQQASNEGFKIGVQDTYLTTIGDDELLGTASDDEEEETSEEESGTEVESEEEEVVAIPEPEQPKVEKGIPPYPLYEPPFLVRKRIVETVMTKVKNVNAKVLDIGGALDLQNKNVKEEFYLPLSQTTKPEYDSNGKFPKLSGLKGQFNAGSLILDEQNIRYAKELLSQLFYCTLGKKFIFLASKESPIWRSQNTPIIEQYIREVTGRASNFVWESYTDEMLLLVFS